MCEQMQSVVIELLRSADNAEMLVKPLSCTKLLRNSCIEKKQSHLYNDWIRKIKELVIDIRQQDFWDRIVEGEVAYNNKYFE